MRREEQQAWEQLMAHWAGLTNPQVGVQPSRPAICGAQARM